MAIFFVGNSAIFFKKCNHLNLVEETVSRWWVGDFEHYGVYKQTPMTA